MTIAAPIVNDPTLGAHLTETQRTRRGHDFYPDAETRAAIPALYSTHDVEDRVIHAHYFVGSFDLYVAEADWYTGEVFGYAQIGATSDWGYSDLAETEAVKVGPLRQPVERDLHWTPKPFSQVRR